MKKLFELNQVDIECYKNTIKDFIPDKIIDIHTHVYTRELLKEDEKSDGRVASWPERVASENPIGDLFETYNLMFPGKTVIPLIFTTPVKLKDLDEAVNRSSTEFFGLAIFTTLLFVSFLILFTRKKIKNPLNA